MQPGISPFLGLKFSRQVFQLLPAQFGLLIREFLSEAGKLLTDRQVRAHRTMALMPSQGAETDGAAIQPLLVCTSSTFSVVEKPIQAPAEFSQTKTFLPRKTMRPPILSESIQISLYRGQGRQKVRSAQLTFIAYAAITLSHQKTPKIIFQFKCIKIATYMPKIKPAPED
jgi:hypothetical protein